MKKIYLLALSLIMLLLIIPGCGSDDDAVPGLKTGDVVTFTLLQTTDVHHRAVGTGPSASYGAADPAEDTTQGGYSRLAYSISQIRAANAADEIPTVLVDSGDFLMGTVYDLTLAEVPAAMAFMNLVEYDAITIGNHEFDYGPAPLADFINNAKGSDGTGFNIPILASNMVTSSTSRDDNGLETLISKGHIKDTVILTLSNKLKVGIIGLLGEDAEADAPLADPVTFKNDLSNAEEVAFIQAKVDYLRSNGAHVVIALSHSGIINPNGSSPTGDDIDLANAVTGIDLIASGHEHARTNSVITVNDTQIICAGSYGQNLAQIDITVTVGTGITSSTLTNNAIDSSVPQDTSVAYMMGLIDTGLNDAVADAGLPPINTLLAVTDSDNLAKPHDAVENGMGNLVADSLRFINYAVALAADATAVPETAVGVVANGVIRDGFAENQQISLADIYSTLPLGMSIDPNHQDVPGYPLLKIYLNEQEIVNMAQLITYVIGAGDYAADPVTVGGTLQTKMTQYTTWAAGICSSDGATVTATLGEMTTACNGGAGDLIACSALTAYDPSDCTGSSTALTTGATLSGALATVVFPALDAEYFMNSSGLTFTHYGVDNLYQVQSASLYAANDFTCSGAGTPIYVIDGSVTPDTNQVYPVIIDMYAFLIMQSETFDTLLSSLNIPIVPRAGTGLPLFTDDNGDPRLIDTSNLVDIFVLLSTRLDQNPASDVFDEVKEWQAFMSYITYDAIFPPDGDNLNQILDAVYGANSRITAVP